MNENKKVMLEFSRDYCKVERSWFKLSNGCVYVEIEYITIYNSMFNYYYTKHIYNTKTRKYYDKFMEYLSTKPKSFLILNINHPFFGDAVKEYIRGS